jgi:sugar (pentulose or hexulose) kinase
VTGPLFAAVDAGTTGARACAVDLAGRVVHEARRPYRTTAPRPGWAEQDARDWREEAVAALGDLVQALGSGSAIAAIGLTGQCPTVVPVDADGEPVGPGMLYRDNRASAEALEMREAIGVEAMHARTGHVADAFHIGPKILWLRRHRPEVFAAAQRFLQPRDVVLRELCHIEATDETHANSTVLFDLRARDWADDLLAAVGLERTLFARVVPPWEQVGEIGRDVAGRTGLPPGCPVVAGAGDSQCAAFGSGVTVPGPISEMAGSSSCLNAVVAEPLADLRVTHYSHVVPDCFCTELGINTTGAAVAWGVSRLGFDGFAAFEAAAARTHAALRSGADPVTAAPLFLPFLGDGERNDVSLRGGFIGLAERHTRDDLAYAVLEGVAFAVADALDAIAAGSPFSDLRVAGGGARLPTLGAIKADVLGATVRHLHADSTAVGAALLAARTAGHADAADAAIAALVDEAASFEPDPAGLEPMRRRREWFRAARASDAVRLAA